eukprot:TRINITY_DN521_c2_g1_i1.p1 TRINITY_DN521_c2_g1~~TRINITY_DN521_c2_g1_i1.p1  ORF type:complete len:570 (+),score=191.70 TRINITY_DN521_c2_g1_i1:77-1711(+)
MKTARTGMKGLRRWASSDATKLVVFDTTLRDGEQSPGCTLNTQEKLVIAKQLSRLGVDVCEAGFPIASDGDFEAVSRIAEDVGSLTEGRLDGSTMTICGLSRATQKDIKRCHDAVKHAPKHRIHTFLATSDIHLQHKLQIDREECIKRAVAAVSFAASLTEDVEFSPEDAGRSDPEFLCKVLAAVIEAGATTLNIPDTVGYNTPQMYGSLIKYLVENTKGADRAIFSTHCHNDLGMATANTLAGVVNGCRQVEVTINGIGERAGNTSLEEIVMITDTHKNLGITTNINTEQIFRSSQMVSAFTGMQVQANKAVVGANAFAHESGIHQDGMLKNRETYEIMTPARVGVSSTSLVMGKHSGRNAFFSRLEELGYSDFMEETKADLFVKFKALADVKKVVTENDLHALVQEDSSRVKEEEVWTLESLQLSAGNINTATVEVCNKETGNCTIDAAIGNGPVDAIVCALNRITNASCILTNFEVKAVHGEDSDSMGEVIVRVKDANETRFMGRGLDVDILKATGKAYISAINKMLSNTPREMNIPEVTP